MMTLETFGPMPPAYADYIRHVLDSARFLLSLIDDILDRARTVADEAGAAASAVPLGLA
jgi:hypothetical protein